MTEIVAVSIDNPLPDPNEFTQNIYDKAWPQVLALSSAIMGIMVVFWIISIFKGS